jgi:hypothetical protein
LAHPWSSRGWRGVTACQAAAVAIRWGHGIQGPTRPEPTEPRRIRGAGTGAAGRVDLPSSYHGGGVERAFGAEFDQQFAAALVRPALRRWWRPAGQRRWSQGRRSQPSWRATAREGGTPVRPQARQAARSQGHRAGRAAEDGTWREPLAGGVRPMRHGVRDAGRGRPHGGGLLRSWGWSAPPAASGSAACSTATR